MDLRSLTKPWLGPLMRQQAMCRAIWLTLAVLALGMLAGLQLWPCMFAEMTGLPCPGCGMTRASLALMRGDLRTALLFHPFVPFFFVLGGFVAAGALLPKAKIEIWAARVEDFERKSRVTVLFLAALLGFSLLRMAGFWYQPPVSGPAGIFKKKSAVSQTSALQIKSHFKS